jgi:SOS-response transcriptional repressor LexA
MVNLKYLSVLTVAVMELYRRAVLEKLYKLRYIGGRHTSIKNVMKGFPKHAKKDIRKAVKALIREGYILSKPTSYGLEISLNPRMIAEIRRILDID